MNRQQALNDINTLLLDLLSEAGGDLDQLVTLLKFQNSAINKATLWQTPLPVLLPAVMKITNKPSFALELGRRIQITSFGTVSFAIMSCLTLRDVLKLMIRYHPIVNLGPRWELHNHPDGIALRSTPIATNPLTHQQLLELTFSAIFSIGESLLNRRIQKGELHLNYPSPQHKRVYREFFSLPIKFNQENSQIILTERDLDIPLPTANPVGNIVFQQQCDALLHELNQVDNVSSAVRRRLIQSGRDFPNINRVAQQLRMSERTLRRRLENESTSFRTICDEVKNVLACQYLTDTEFTVAEIADLLGYSEPVSFRRAFIRWNQLTPNAYRQAH